MSIRLKIFSVSFVVVFAFLQAQPLFSDPFGLSSRQEMTCVPVSSPRCSLMKKSACISTELPCEEDQNESDCNNNCNPCVPCSIGFCCYLVENFFSYSASYTIEKQKIVPSNDNRLSSVISECWHPPELRS